MFLYVNRVNTNEFKYCKYNVDIFFFFCYTHIYGIYPHCLSFSSTFSFLSFPFFYIWIQCKHALQLSILFISILQRSHTNTNTHTKPHAHILALSHTHIHSHIHSHARTHTHKQTHICTRGSFICLHACAQTHTFYQRPHTSVDVTELKLNYL